MNQAKINPKTHRDLLNLLGMSIAIVSADRHLVEPLHKIFESWGIAPFYSFKNLNEFNLAFSRTQKQLSILLMDAELPIGEQVRIRAQFRTHPVLKHCIYGWLGPVSLENEHSLGDFHFGVPRPFGIKTLITALFFGARRKKLEGNEVLHLGTPEPELSFDLFEKRHIKIVISYDDPALWDLRLKRSNTGVILVNPRGTSPRLNRWLELYNTMPQSRNNLIVCLGRKMPTVSPVRTSCQVFVESPVGEKELDILLKKVRTRFLHSTEISFHLSAQKTALREGDLKRAAWHTKALEKNFPNYFESKLSTGKLQKKLGYTQKADETLMQAMEINPYSPELYAQLLKLHDPRSPKHQELKTLAQNHCPNWLVQFEAQQ